MDATDWKSLDQLGRQEHRTWQNIVAARSKALDTLARLGNSSFPQMPADTSFVVFGSLARLEETETSDIDWTMLIDGQADARHQQFAHAIDGFLTDQSFAKPSPTGAFGKLSFSHELVNRVGGEQDTNKNTTQRVLLLLESCAPVDDAVRKRVITQLFNRYLEDDVTYQSEQKEVRVPRFLLNDIVRFWRTMAVDFPAKQRDRNGKGWALRNFKLRMSRKLIFASGLLICLNARVRPELLREDETDADGRWPLQEYLATMINRPPLETLAEAFLHYGNLASNHEIVTDLADAVSAYDDFLGILNDESKRKLLDSLDRTGARSEPLFANVCAEIGDRFQRGLTTLFFKSYEPLTTATQRYGVF